jgi:hypothetical protein
MSKQPSKLHTVPSAPNAVKLVIIATNNLHKWKARRTAANWHTKAHDLATANVELSLAIQQFSAMQLKYGVFTCTHLQFLSHRSTYYVANILQYSKKKDFVAMCAAVAESEALSAKVAATHDNEGQLINA